MTLVWWGGETHWSPTDSAYDCPQCGVQHFVTDYEFRPHLSLLPDVRAVKMVEKSTTERALDEQAAWETARRVAHEARVRAERAEKAAICRLLDDLFNPE